MSSAKENCVVGFGIFAGLSAIAASVAYFKCLQIHSDDDDEEDTAIVGGAGDMLECDPDLQGSADVQDSNLSDMRAESLTRPQAEVLARLLSSQDPEMLKKVLITIANAAAFTQNQHMLREVGCLQRLVRLLHTYTMALKVGSSMVYPAVVTNVLTAVNNLAMNADNQPHLKECLPALVELAKVECGPLDDSLHVATLQTLTNLSVLPEMHAPYTQLIQTLYAYVDSTQLPNLRIHSLRVLANLSTNPQMVPHLLAAKAPTCVLDLLHPDTDPPVLLRWLTIIANVTESTKAQSLTAATLPTQYKAASPETMYTALYGLDTAPRLRSKVYVLCRHANSDVCQQAARIHSVHT